MEENVFNCSMVYSKFQVVKEFDNSGEHLTKYDGIH